MDDLGRVPCTRCRCRRSCSARRPTTSGSPPGSSPQGNDELAGLRRPTAPDRLLGLGSVPLGWPGAADEARRALDDLGMAGIAIGSRGGGRDLDDPVNDDLWALLSERRTFVFLHPSGVPDPHRAERLLAAPAGRLPDGDGAGGGPAGVRPGAGALPPHLCLAHGGGCLPSLRGRLDMGWDRKDVARTTPCRPSEFTDRLYYDTAVFSTALLRRLVEDVGVEPRPAGHRPPVRTRRPGPAGDGAALGLDPADTRRILGGNAAELLGLPVQGA